MRCGIDEMLKIRGNDTIIEFKLRDKDISNKNIEFLFNYSRINWSDLPFNHNTLIDNSVECLDEKSIDDYTDTFSDRVIGSAFPIDMLGYKIEGCEPVVTLSKATGDDCDEIIKRLITNEKETLKTIHNITFRCLMFDPDKGVTGVSRPVTVKLTINGNESPRDCVERLLLQDYTTLLTFSRNWEIIEVICETKNYKWEALPNVIGVLPLLRRGSISHRNISDICEFTDTNSEFSNPESVDKLFKNCKSVSTYEIPKIDCKPESRELTLYADDLEGMTSLRNTPLKTYKKLKSNSDKPYLGKNERIKGSVKVSSLKVNSWSMKEVDIFEACEFRDVSCESGIQIICNPVPNDPDITYILSIRINPNTSNMYFTYAKTDPDIEDLSYIEFKMIVEDR